MTTAIGTLEADTRDTTTATEPGPIIVASDGGAPATTALAVAGRLRELTGARIHVVSVIEPLAAVVPAPLLLAASVHDSRVQQRHDLVREQVDRILGTTPRVDVELAIGWPPDVLTEAVRSADASFFVAGKVHHGRIERLARTETALAVLRGAGAPVLALPSGMTHEPRCVVVGVDLGASSIAAARRAAPLLRHVEKVYLLHVQEPVAPLAEIPYVPPNDEAEIHTAMTAVRSALGLPRAAAVESRVLVGHTAFELADFAEYVRADLIVLGHEHRGLWGRMLHASVAARTYRAASCGVLLVPHDVRDAAISDRADVANAGETGSPVVDRSA